MAEGKSKANKIIALVIFLVFFAAVGYGIYYFFFAKKVVKIPTNDPLINKARAKYEQDMINWIKSAKGNKTHDAYLWYEAIRTDGGTKPTAADPSDEKIRGAVQWERYKDTNPYTYTEGGVVKWTGAIGTLYGG